MIQNNTIFVLIEIKYKSLSSSPIKTILSVFINHELAEKYMEREKDKHLYDYMDETSYNYQIQKHKLIKELKNDKN